MTTFETHRNTFTHLLPEILHLAAVAFRYLDPESQEEAVQNCIVLTWKAFLALIEQGRADDPGLIKSCLWYSIRQTRVGRRAEGESRAKDVHKNARRGRVQFQWTDLRHLVSDQTPVPEAVSFRLDVPAFLGTLSDRQRRMAESLLEGSTTSEVATTFGVTPGAVSQFRNRFKQLYEAFMAG
jgi:hypothetical protein